MEEEKKKKKKKINLFFVFLNKGGTAGRIKGNGDATHITTPYAPEPISRTSFHRFSRWKVWSNDLTLW
jgi:hypothetical protein